MNHPSHTPSPWTVNRNYAVNLPDGQQVRIVRANASQRANARLISAAPDMADAIREMEAHAIVGDAPAGTAIVRLEDYNALVSALAKATGDAL